MFEAVVAILLLWSPDNESFREAHLTRHCDHFEIAVAFRPEEFLNYTLNATALHADGARAVGILNRIVRMEIVPAPEIEVLPAPRKRIVETISRLARAANVRDQVISAYEQRCAVTRVQLKLIDAAHIHPVGAEGSTDSVRNGICLAPTYHRAYDQALIHLTPDFKMKISPGKLEKLNALNLAGGLDYFRRYLDQAIFLPANPQQRPGVDYIRKANAFRGIAA